MQTIENLEKTTSETQGKTRKTANYFFLEFFIVKKQAKLIADNRKLKITVFQIF